MTIFFPRYLSTGSEYPSMTIGDADLEENKKKVFSKMPIGNVFFIYLPLRCYRVLRR